MTPPRSIRNLKGHCVARPVPRGHAMLVELSTTQRAAAVSRGGARHDFFAGAAELCCCRRTRSGDALAAPRPVSSVIHNSVSDQHAIDHAQKREPGGCSHDPTKRKEKEKEDTEHQSD